MSDEVTPRLKGWSLAQNRERPELNEDAVRAELDVGPEEWSAFLAVSDGVGSTAFAGQWAQALIDAAEPAWATGGLMDGAERVRASFDPLATNDGVDFVLEELWVERGSAATLLVATVQSEGERTHCRVAAVGDSVLMIAEPERFTSFPLRASEQFANRTEAVRSRGASGAPKAWAGELPAGSFVAMASDGIGRWIVKLSETEGPGAVHDWLREVSEPTLPDVDDDLTLLVLEVPAGGMPHGGWLHRLW